MQEASQDLHRQANISVCFQPAVQVTKSVPTIPRKGLFFLFLILFSAVWGRLNLARTNPPSLNELWDISLEAFEQNKHEQASRLFTEWINISAKEGIRSTEAHYNVALSHLALNRMDLSVLNLMKSASLSDSPFQLLRLKKILSSIQNKLGIIEPVTDQTGFLFTFFITKNILLMLMAFFFWAGIVLMIFFLHWGKRRHGHNWIYVSTILSMLFMAVALLLIHQIQVNRYGVISVQVQETPIYQIPDTNEDRLLVKLPPGTLVSRLEEKEGFLKIDGPVSGWVELKNVLLTDH